MITHGHLPDGVVHRQYRLQRGRLLPVDGAAQG